jgi:hypothetical protein
MITSALVWELKHDSTWAYFTIAEEPRAEFVPFKPLYLKYTVDEPTEYDFAINVFGSWRHWQKMQDNKEFYTYLETVRDERDTLIEANALREIIKESKTGKNAFAAAKFLVTKGYITDPVAKKAKTKKTSADEDEDFKRIIDGEYL